LGFFTEGNEGSEDPYRLIWNTSQKVTNAGKKPVIPTELVLPSANQTDDESKDISL
jgi:hypothetical protein